MSELNEEGQELTVQDYNQETGEVTLIDNAGNKTVVKILGPTPAEVGGRKRRKNKSKRKNSHKKSMRRRK